MKKLFLILAAVLISSASMYAQETKPPEIKPQVQKDEDTFPPDTEKLVNLYDNGVGLSYSTISGYGLTFLRRFFNDYSVCLSGMITYNEYMQWSDMSKTKVVQDSKNNLYDFGLEIQRDIISSTRTKIYVMIGGYFSTEKNKDQSNDKVENIISVGTGFGFELYLGRHFAGTFHFGYKFQNTDDQGNTPSLRKETTVGVGFGALFLF
jgi:hypothetical protein